MEEIDLIRLAREGTVHFDAPAKLHEQPLGLGYLRGGPVYDGTLRGAVRRYLEVQGQGGAWFTIGINAGVIEGCDGALLRTPVILELSRRDEFHTT